MRYYILECDPPWIYCFDDAADLSEYINSDFAEDRSYPKHVILREDGIICKIRLETIPQEIVEFEETNDVISPASAEACVSKLFDKLKVPSTPVTTLAELQTTLDFLCNRKDQLQRRFDRWAYVFVILAASIGLWLPVLIWYFL